MSVEPFNMAAATLENEEIDPSQNESKLATAILKVKDSVIESSEQLIKNVTGREVHLAETNNNHHVDSKSVNQTPSLPVTVKAVNTNGQVGQQNFSSPVKGKQPSASKPNATSSSLSAASAAVTASISLEEDHAEEEQLSPEEAAKKWEEELERVKREKKWETELARIKREKEMAKTTPPPRVESISSLTTSPAGLQYDGAGQVKTAPVADTSCSICVIS